MVPAEEDGSRPKARDDPANPFVAFRRFADEQMSNLVSGIFGVWAPSHLSPPSSNRVSQDHHAWLQLAQHSLRHETEEAIRILDVYTNACKDIQKDSQTAVQDDSKPLRCPYRPPGQEVTLKRRPAHHELPSTGSGDYLPSSVLAAPLLRKDFPSVPSEYLLYSPYSPIHLDRHRVLSNQGMQWREAFEDLLAVQDGDGQSCAEEDINWSTVDWVSQTMELAMPEEDWDERNRRVNLAPWRYKCMKSRSPAERQLENNVAEREPKLVQRIGDQDGEQITELDLYNQKFSPGHEEFSNPLNSFSKSHSRSIRHAQYDSDPSNNDSANPSILSTLTTTERTTLLDGSVHTKVVLKKRFSDGREESIQTTHTQNPTPNLKYQPPTETIESQVSNANSSEPVCKAKKTKGWFWS